MLALEGEAQVNTDSSFGCRKLPYQSVIKYSAHEYVRGDVHANGIESMWAMFKRAHKGVYHKMSPNHMPVYVDE